MLNHPKQDSTSFYIIIGNLTSLSPMYSFLLISCPVCLSTATCSFLYVKFILLIFHHQNTQFCTISQVYTVVYNVHKFATITNNKRKISICSPSLNHMIYTQFIYGSLHSLLLSFRMMEPR